MKRERLLAKSARDDIHEQTIHEHTSSVMRSAEALIDATGESQLSALGLDPAHWLAPFRRAVLVSALLHDLGKANDHFQGMIRDPWKAKPQGLRHEAVSFLIARLAEIQDWIAPALEGARPPDLVLWAIAGHHRKFPPESAPDGSGSEMNIYLDHPDFHQVLELGCHGLALGPPPRFDSSRKLRQLFATSSSDVLNEFREARVSAKRMRKSLSPDERRFLAAVKACLICADVAGSIGRRGNETMADWIPEAFKRVPSAEQVKGIVAKRLGVNKPRKFQNEIAKASGNLALVVAGCGTGKTAAAYARAARRHPGQRVFFCYPTTGTATEGYRDYLADPDLGADLIHGRAEVDKKAMRSLFRGSVPTDAVSAEIHDDKPKHAASDSAGALEQWSTPIVSCTVDTVLGLLQNNRRGVYAWPSIAGSFCVFDEIHAYDEKLFAALLRFLKELPGIPSLLMTASLPDDRLRRIQEVMRERGAREEPIHGPARLEKLKRYRRDPGNSTDDAWRLVREAHDRNEKVLWVVNTVDAAISLAESCKAKEFNPIVYHSRFRYLDRVRRHRNVIAAFDPRKNNGFALAITTQVAEMSLDLSADLLVTHMASIPAMIQRLGRLNRRAKADKSSGLRPFLVLKPDFPAPYEQHETDAARRWLDKLGDGPISQRKLVDAWREIEPKPAAADDDSNHAWFDGGFETMSKALRDAGSVTDDVILERDAAKVRAKRRKLEEVRIPMPRPPRGLRVDDWRFEGFCPVAPTGTIDYCPRRGARWTS